MKGVSDLSTSTNSPSNTALMSSNCMLTTVDNPYNPFNDFAQWYMFDVEHGHNSCGHLATIANVSDEMSDTEYMDEMERAIDDIIANDILNIYKKIYINNTTQLVE